MTDVASLLSAISTFSWPALALVVVIRFGPQIAAVIESAKSRSFKIKVGGQELTVDEANEQQRSLIADLQAQVASVREALASQGSSIPAATSDPSASVKTSASVLWADDEPKNNSYFIEWLTDRGADVDLALSTAQALKLAGRKRYDLILSDMGRVEDGKFNPTAGLSLLAEVRKAEPGVPYVFFTSSRTAAQHRAEVQARGALITNSGTELTEILRQQLAPRPGKSTVPAVAKAPGS